MNWIRIAVGIHDDPRIGRMADSCRSTVNEMVGAVCGVLCALPQHARDGDVGSVPDRMIEQWAQWSGRRGVFAAVFRAELCENGTVRSWERHNGAALRRMEDDVERKRKAAEFRKVSAGNPQEFRKASSVDVDETKTGTTTTSRKADDDDVTPSPAVVAIFSQIAPCVAPVGHDALRDLLTTVKEPTTWAGIIRGCASGQSMPEARPASPQRLAAAVQDFVAGGHHRDPRGLTKLFRGYVTNSKASAAQTRSMAPTLEEDRAEELRLLREQNERRRMRHEAPKPEPTWAKQIDATFPDGRTWPAGRAA